MKELEEHIIREYDLEVNKGRMDQVRRNMKKSLIYNAYFGLVMCFVSVAYMYLWLSYTNAALIMNSMLDEETELIHFPFCGITIFLCPVITVLSFLADAFLYKKFNVISRWIYLGMLIFGITDMMFHYAPMNTLNGLIIIFYSAAGMWMEDFAIRSYPELDELVKCEGFPDFNPMLEIPRHSKYVKYRKKWLEKNKALDYYTDDERPIEEYNVTPAENSSAMDGVSVDNDKSEMWFEGKDPKAPKPPNSMMEELSGEGMEFPPESDYIVEDVRKKPL